MSPFIPLLHARLAALASDRSRTFWERYLKGALPFRGVPMASLRAAVHAWWLDDGPAALPKSRQKALALELFEGRFGEDKLAGTLVLNELLLDDLTLPDARRFGLLFECGQIADWNSCDWFCVKVLGPLVARDLPSRDTAELITSWREARSVWQRRAANVAFVNLAGHGDANFAGFTRLMLETCSVTVRSGERFAQTGVGWLLRELADVEQAAVWAFTRENLTWMSREGVRYAVERMPRREQSTLLEAHRQAARRQGGRRP